MKTLFLPAALLSLFVVALFDAGSAFSADLTVKLSGDTSDISLFGAVKRWDGDGNPLRKVDVNEKIPAPFVDAKAEETSEGRWVFRNLPSGTYDLVLVKESKKIRLEGFRFAPVMDFDPFLPPEAKVEKIGEDGRKTIDNDTIDWITKDIKNSKHYENKVVPLHLAAPDAKAGMKQPKFVRILVMLVRDLETTYEAGSATMRFEIWQYDDKHGGYAKNSKTMVLNRVILQRDELVKWNWLWLPNLGNVEMGGANLKIDREIPDLSKDKTLKGLGAK